MKCQIENFQHADIRPEQVCFIYHDEKILMLGDRLPVRSELDLSLENTETVFKLKEGWALPGQNYAKKTSPGKLEFRSLREALNVLAIPIAKDAALGAQYVNWSSGTQFCGSCGTKLAHSTVRDQDSVLEIAKVCKGCKRTHYPQLTPVVIVLVKRGRDVLLARGLPPRKYYSCLAGFTEPGETLEEAIRREVKEEVGVEVKNIKYFGSQPWPFPNNLMIGFTADWVAGDIKIDDKELVDAQWFSKDSLPELPSTISIARQMIEAFKKG